MTSAVETRFRPLEAFRAKAGETYSLLPFRFQLLESNRYFLTNFAGECVVLPRDTVHALVRHTIPMHSETYNTLKARHFLIDGDSSVAVDLLAAKYRTKQAFLAQFTSLFMFVTTLRCDHSCAYCQVSGGRAGQSNVDMTEEVATRAVDFMFRSPSMAIKVEFQGGESLLNFGIVKHVVRIATEKNQTGNRSLAFVITTNLSALTDEAVGFAREHNIYFSTSLDGPRNLHNANRPRPGHDSYKEAVCGIQRIMEALGSNKVSALMTTTRASLSQTKAIIDEYVRQGLRSIFLRVLNPYGRAATTAGANGYTMGEWLRFYREALAYIIELNGQGVLFREEFTSLLLRKIHTPYATGYVDLQSPAGIGISGIVFNYDGSVYPSDEARMLAEMGDSRFLMGNLLEHSYEKIMLSDALMLPLRESIAECVPQCADCAAQPYCGSDPVRHYRTQGDLVGFKPTSDFCQRNLAVIRHLLCLLEDDGAAASVLKSWV